MAHEIAHGDPALVNDFIKAVAGTECDAFDLKGRLEHPNDRSWESSDEQKENNWRQYLDAYVAQEAEQLSDKLTKEQRLAAAEEKVNDAYIFEEIMADMFGATMDAVDTRAAAGDNIFTVINRTKPNVVKRILNALKRFVARLKGKDSYLAEAQRQQAERLRRVLSDTLSRGYGVNLNGESARINGEGETGKKYSVAGEKLLSFYDSVSSMKDKKSISKRKADLGEISEAHRKLLERTLESEINKKTDLSGYTLWIDGSGAQHIEERHGKDGSSDQSMARDEDIKLIPWAANNATSAIVVRNSDGSIDTDAVFKNSDGSPAPKIKTSTPIGNDTFYVVESVPDSASKRIYIKSAYKKRSNSDQVLNMESDDSPQPTPKASRGYTASSIDSISQKLGDVKKKFSMSEDSKGKTLSDAQREYFADSKVVDDDGRLLRVYHGSPRIFTEFSHRFMSEHGSAEGQGFYFTDNKDMAEGYKKDGGKLFDGYLNITKPLSDSEVTMTKSEVKRLLKAIDPTGDDVVINYDSKGGMGYPSKAWYERSLNDAVNMIYNNADTDSEILGEIANAGAGTENTVKTARSLFGYDGYIVKGKYDGANVYVAFESNQFKNVDNVTPSGNPDIRFSLSYADDGNAFTAVNPDSIFELESIEGDSFPAKVRNYLKKYRNTVLPLGSTDKAYFRREAENEYTNPAKRLDENTYSSKLKAASEIENILYASKFLRHEKDDGRHKDAVRGWNYYETVFTVPTDNGVKVYSGEISIKLISRGDCFYDITKIKDITNGTDGQAYLKAAISAYDITDTSVTQKTPDVNSNYTQFEEKNSKNQKFSLVGETFDGIEVYETSEEIRNLTNKERMKRFEEIMKNEYLGRTAKFIRNGHTYYATFEDADINKNIYGDRQSSSKGWKAKIRAGADGDIFEFVENADYIGSRAEQGKNIPAHKGMNRWDYFVKTVQIDNEVFDVLANVRRNSDDSFVYNISLRENKKIKASPPIGIQENSVITGAQRFIDNSISQNSQNVNSFEEKNSKNQKFSLSQADSEYLKAVEDGDTETAQRLVDEAAEAKGYDRLFRHGAKKGGGFTEFRDWSYFTESKEYAERYAKRGDGKSLYEVYANLGNVFDTRDEACRKLFEEMRSEYGLGELQENGLPDWTDGYDIADFIDENGLDYDSIILDEGGDLVNGEPVSRGLSYVIRSSEQIKSADTVTYDNDGNVIPLSERFDSGKKDIRWSISRIVGEDGTDYGNGVVLDSTLLENLTDSERKEMVKEYVKELGGQTFTAFDENGDETEITIVPDKRWFKNKNGKRVPANSDLSKKYSNSKIKQEAITLIDELIEASGKDGSAPSKYSHDWLDNNGKNDWEYRTTYIQDKNNTVWKARLNVAVSQNGERILYDIDPIKKVGQRVKSRTIPTDNSISQNGQNVNSQESENISVDERHSVVKDEQKSVKTLINEKAKLKQKVADLRQELTLTHGRKLSRDALLSNIAQLADRYGSKITPDALYKDVTELYDRMYNKKVNGKRVKRVETQLIVDQMDGIVDAIIENATERNTDYDEYRGLLTQLRETKLIVPLDNRAGAASTAGYDSWAAFRKANFGRVGFVNEGTDGGIAVDTVYQELSEKFPELFPDSITHPGEQAAQIADVATATGNAICTGSIRQKRLRSGLRTELSGNGRSIPAISSI